MTFTDAAIPLSLALLGFVLTGLFAGLETGVYTLNRVRLAVRSARGEKAAVTLRRHLRDSNRTLTVLLIGTNAASYMASLGLAQYLHHFDLSEWSLVAVEAAIFTPLIFIFAETLPKDLFRTHTDRWTYVLAPVISLARWLFTITLVLPVIHVITRGLAQLLGQGERDAVTARERVSHLIKEGLGAGVISESQTTLADRALALRTRKIGGEMVPWPAVVTIDVDALPRDRDAVMARVTHTRLPVVDAEGAVVGVLSTVDAVIERTRPTRELMVDVETAPDSMRVVEALRLLRRSRRSMAIVIGDDGKRPVGIVTLKDLVEPLTGELAAW